MQGIGLRSAGLSLFVLAAVSLTFAEGHPSKATRAAMPLPTDWSHRHLIFSQPTTAEKAVKVQRDERYQLQLQQHELRPTATLGGRVEDAARARRRHRRGRRMHRDWSWDLGGGAKVGPAFFPAKYAFDVTTASCVGSSQPDYIVYGTGVAPSDSQGSIVALTNLYSGCARASSGQLLELQHRRNRAYFARAFTGWNASRLRAEHWPYFQPGLVAVERIRRND